MMLSPSIDLEEIDQVLPFLAAGARKILAPDLGRRRLAKGETLYCQGDDADGLFFLVAGKLAVQKPTGFGKRMQVVALLDAGAPIGEAGVLANTDRGATVVAVVESSLLHLPRHVFEKLVATEPQLAIDLLRWLMTRLSLRLKKTSERLALVL